MMKMKMQVLGWKATVKGNELIDIGIISRKKKVRNMNLRYSHLVQRRRRILLKLLSANLGFRFFPGRKDFLFDRHCHSAFSTQIM
jgi:hypothetical protein